MTEPLFETTSKRGQAKWGEKNKVGVAGFLAKTWARVVGVESGQKQMMAAMIKKRKFEEEAFGWHNSQNEVKPR